jgi:hypothetical protein
LGFVLEKADERCVGRQRPAQGGMGQGHGKGRVRGRSADRGRFIRAASDSASITPGLRIWISGARFVAGRCLGGDRRDCPERTWITARPEANPKPVVWRASSFRSSSFDAQRELLAAWLRGFQISTTSRLLVYSSKPIDKPEYALIGWLKSSICEACMKEPIQTSVRTTTKTRRRMGRRRTPFECS